MREPSGPWLVPIWLASAAAVGSVRLATAANLGYDLALQVEAAQNLLGGKGLAFYEQTASSLNNGSTLTTLTHFPSGYSLLTAALMALGLHVGTVINLLGLTATLLGWCGWAKLSLPFFSEGLKKGTAWRLAAWVVAACTPLFFTQVWSGTDIFLWASVPWSILLLSNRSRQSASWRDAALGALCGFCILMRYASVFLAAFIGVMILWQSRSRLQALASRSALFAVGLLPAIAAQGYIITHAVSSSPAAPGGISLNSTAGHRAAQLLDGLFALYAANVAFAFWMPGKALTLLFPARIGAFPWQLGVVAAGVILLAAAFAKAIERSADPSHDARTIAVLFVAGLPLFLLFCTLFGRYNYVSDLRYYEPAIPLALFIAYDVASRRHAALAPTSGVLAWTAATYLIGYVALAIVYSLFLFAPGSIGRAQRQKFTASDSPRWFSMGIEHEASPARQLVLRLLADEPGSLLLTSRPAWFIWDQAIDRSQVALLDCSRLKATRVDGPARIVIITFNLGEAEDLWSYSGNGYLGAIVRAPCLSGLSDASLVQEFPDEGLKVLEARVAAGRRVVLNADSGGAMSSAIQ